jgi:ubiquinol-cytochrome c reductase cytochrome c1 subunit
MRRSILSLAPALLAIWASSALAAELAKPPAQSWSFSGFFGTFDRAAAQRGLQVYTEVCAGCHSLKLVAYRNLTALGYGEDDVKAIAAKVEVTDGPNDQGEMFKRPGRPSDRFASPFANDNAAKAANNGALPPDLSLIVKARNGGADYLHALLTGYGDPPNGVTLMEGMNYNKYFPGNQIAMPPPIRDDGVTYQDGTKATTAQMSKDLTMFLAWAAEPELEVRKQMGIKVILFLLVFTGILYAAKRKVWADVH